MANVKDVKSKAVKITVTDGVERSLKFTLNAMAELEDKYGSVEAAFEELDKGSIKAVRFILWAGLIHEDESLSEKTVGNLIDIQLMQDLMGSVGEALGNDMPEQENSANTEGAPDPNV